MSRLACRTRTEDHCPGCANGGCHTFRCMEFGASLDLQLGSCSGVAEGAPSLQSHWWVFICSIICISAGLVVHIAAADVDERLWVADVHKFWCCVRSVYSDFTVSHVIHRCCCGQVWWWLVRCRHESFWSGHELVQREQCVVDAVDHALEA